MNSPTLLRMPKPKLKKINLSKVVSRSLKSASSYLKKILLLYFCWKRFQLSYIIQGDEEQIK